MYVCHYTPRRHRIPCRKSRIGNGATLVALSNTSLLLTQKAAAVKLIMQEVR